MIDVIKNWVEKHFSDPQAIILVTFLALGFILVLYWGEILTPVLASITIAYILEGLVRKINSLGVPRFVAFLISYALFLTALSLILFGLIPLVISQVSQLVLDFPNILNKLQLLILSIPEKYPVFADQEIEKMLGNFSSELVSVGQTLVSVSLESAADVFTVIVYLVVVPLLVFFHSDVYSSAGDGNELCSHHEFAGGFVGDYSLCWRNCSNHPGSNNCLVPVGRH
jgi:putative permease